MSPGARMCTVPPTIEVKKPFPVSPLASISAAVSRGSISRSPAAVMTPRGAVTVIGMRTSSASVTTSTYVLASTRSHRMGVLVKGTMTMPNDTRARMIEATVEALQRQGVAGMSFTDVLAASGAARGAIYHHFPGGKAQMVAEAAALNGQDVRARLAALPADSPSAVVEAFLAAVRPVVGASAAGGGCAVAAVTVRAGAGDDNDALRQVAANAFASWAGQLAERLTTVGLSP